MGIISNIVTSIGKMNASVPVRSGEYRPLTFRPVLTWCVVVSLLFHACTTSSQVTAPIETLNGKAFYMHKVEKGQTLYSLSKLYKCDINEILEANPGTDKGLNEGSTIKIPADKARVNKQDLVTEGGKSFILHEVKKKETAYSIAKQYDLDINELMAANKGIEDGLKKGSTVRIPIKSREIKLEIPQGARVHKVVQGETLYGISKSYGVTEKEIEELNPGVSLGLKIDQTLIIPAEQTQDPLKTLPLANERNAERRAPHLKNQYKIALMLPFYSGVADTSLLNDKERKLQDISLNIYRGSLMALDSLEKAGLRAEFNIYDVPDKAAVVTKIIESPGFSETDLVIGPIFRDAISTMNAWSANRDIHIVCPVSQNNKILLGSPNISKAIAGSGTEWEVLADYVYDHHREDNVILINSINVEDARNVQLFRNGWKLASGKDSSLIEIKSQNRTVPGIKSLLKSSGKNIIICPSNDHLLITSLLKNLDNCTNAFVYGTKDWKNMELIDADQRVNFHIQYTENTYINYSSPEIQEWIGLFRQRFKSEPSEYAFIGYDLMMYYGHGLEEYGSVFPDYFDLIDQGGMIANGFEYVKTGVESGFENHHVFVVPSYIEEKE